jgi:hypothetical protein
MALGSRAHEMLEGPVARRAAGSSRSVRCRSGSVRRGGGAASLARGSAGRPQACYTSSCRSGNVHSSAAPTIMSNGTAFTWAAHPAGLRRRMLSTHRRVTSLRQLCAVARANPRKRSLRTGGRAHGRSSSVANTGIVAGGTREDATRGRRRWLRQPGGGRGRRTSAGSCGDR